MSMIRGVRVRSPAAESLIKGDSLHCRNLDSALAASCPCDK